MRLFWSLFFLGSMLVIGADVMERRNTRTLASEPDLAIAEGDAMPFPTPRM